MSGSNDQNIRIRSTQLSRSVTVNVPALAYFITTLDLDMFRDRPSRSPAFWGSIIISDLVIFDTLRTNLSMNASSDNSHVKNAMFDSEIMAPAPMFTRNALFPMPDGDIPIQSCFFPNPPCIALSMSSIPDVTYLNRLAACTFAITDSVLTPNSIPMSGSMLTLSMFFIRSTRKSKSTWPPSIISDPVNSNSPSMYAFTDATTSAVSTSKLKPLSVFINLRARSACSCALDCCAGGNVLNHDSYSSADGVFLYSSKNDVRQSYTTASAESLNITERTEPLNCDRNIRSLKALLTNSSQIGVTLTTSCPAR